MAVATQKLLAGKCGEICAIFSAKFAGGTLCSATKSLDTPRLRIIGKMVLTPPVPPVAAPEAVPTMDTRRRIANVTTYDGCTLHTAESILGFNHPRGRI